MGLLLSEGECGHCLDLEQSGCVQGRGSVVPENQSPELHNSGFGLPAGFNKNYVPGTVLNAYMHYLEILTTVLKGRCYDQSQMSWNCTW